MTNLILASIRESISIKKKSVPYFKTGTLGNLNTFNCLSYEVLDLNFWRFFNMGFEYPIRCSPDNHALISSRDLVPTGKP